MSIEGPSEKFQNVIASNEGTEYLLATTVDDRFRKAHGDLVKMISSNTYLEDNEKDQILVLTNHTISREVEGLNMELEAIRGSEDSEKDQKRQALYEEGVALVTRFTEGLSLKIDEAADRWIIFDDEFQDIMDYLDQVPIQHTGIARLDAMTSAQMNAGVPPEAALQIALVTNPQPLTVYELRTLAQRFPDLPLSTTPLSCVKINSGENLRDLEGNRVVRKAEPGELFQVCNVLPTTGKYQYAIVENPSGKRFKLCINDGNNVQLLNYINGEFSECDLSSIVEREDAENPPNSDMKEMQNKGYCDSQGVLSSSVNSLKIQNVLPAGVMEARISFKLQNNGLQIPSGTPIPIRRSGETFVFAGEWTGLGRADGRVRVYEGDRITINEVQDKEIQNIDSGLEEEPTSQGSIPLTVAALLTRYRREWEAPSYVPNAVLDKPVCALSVQRALEGMYGHDFVKKIFIKDGEFQDAWYLSKSMVESGYGKEEMDFTKYFEVNRARIRLDESQEGYDADRAKLIETCFEARAQTGLFLPHYKRTATNSTLRAEQANGAALNSHAMLILGPRPKIQTAKKDQTLADAIIDGMKDELGESYDDSWETNRGLLTHLKKVTVDRQPVTFQNGEFYFENGDLANVENGTSFRYTDVQVHDFYHNPSFEDRNPSRLVGFVGLMIQGNMEPVKLSLWDPNKVQNSLPSLPYEEFIPEFANVTSDITDLATFLGDKYDSHARSNPEFARGNPDRSAYIKRTLNYYRQTQIVFEGEVPPLGTVLPIVDWSKDPREKVVSKASEKPSWRDALLSQFWSNDESEQA